jgi:hypothetical protein
MAEKDQRTDRILAQCCLTGSTTLVGVAASANIAQDFAWGLIWGLFYFWGCVWTLGMDSEDATRLLRHMK